jgi:hypothetical protein
MFNWHLYNSLLINSPSFPTLWMNKRMESCLIGNLNLTGFEILSGLSLLKFYSSGKRYLLNFGLMIIS